MKASKKKNYLTAWNRKMDSFWIFHCQKKKKTDDWKTVINWCHFCLHSVMSAWHYYNHSHVFWPFSSNYSFSFQFNLKITSRTTSSSRPSSAQMTAGRRSFYKHCRSFCRSLNIQLWVSDWYSGERGVKNENKCCIRSHSDHLKTQEDNEEQV